MTRLPPGYPPLPARVLSVKPFMAWAIVHGGKDIENRTRRTNYRGRVLVHASNYRSRDELEDDFARVRQLCPRVPMEVDAGGIVGSVEIVACMPWPESRWVDCVRSKKNGDVRVTDSHRRWATGPCCWVLTKPQTLPYFECKGALGIWTLKRVSTCE